MTQDEILELEKTFMEYEGDYVLQLINNPVFKKYAEEYFQLSNEELIERYKTAFNLMEAGEVSENEEDNIEIIMIMSVLAMSDKVKKLVKTKTPEVREDNHGRMC